MNNWTNEAMRAEANYRREALHRLVSPRLDRGSRRGAVWQRLLGRTRH